MGAQGTSSPLSDGKFCAYGHTYAIANVAGSVSGSSITPINVPLRSYLRAVRENCEASHGRLLIAVDTCLVEATMIWASIFWYRAPGFGQYMQVCCRLKYVAVRGHDSGGVALFLTLTLVKLLSLDLGSGGGGVHDFVIMACCLSIERSKRLIPMALYLPHI